MNREEFEAIIKEVNDAKVCGIPYVEDECELFVAAKPKLLQENMDVDRHRWYEISTSVYAVGEWFLGLTGVSNVFSETMGFDDCCVDTVACEMQEFASVTYRPKR